MDELCHNTVRDASQGTRRSRKEIVAKLVSFEEACQRVGVSGRRASRALAVPPSTLRGWYRRKKSIEAPAALVAFFESPEGLAWLHRLVLVAQLIITLLSPGSIRLVCLFLELTGLDRFVASSYGSQQKAIERLEQELGRFGAQELARLGRLMSPKKITVIEDETFHPEICLVALEAASGFIFLEMYAPSRDAETWTEKLTAVLGQLPVKVIQVTSDEAKALIKHAEEKMALLTFEWVFYPPPVGAAGHRRTTVAPARSRSGRRTLVGGPHSPAAHSPP